LNKVEIVVRDSSAIDKVAYSGIIVTSFPTTEYNPNVKGTTVGSFGHQVLLKNTNPQSVVGIAL